MSPDNDTYGVAQIDGSQLRFAVQSPTGTLGTNSDYPIFTVSLRVPAGASIGSISPVSIGGGGLRFLSPTGAVYPTEMKNGSVTVADGISIDDVNPGSADLQAGSVVSIAGRGFCPTTRVKFDSAKLSAVQLASIRPTFKRCSRRRRECTVSGFVPRTSTARRPRTSLYQRTVA